MSIVDYMPWGNEVCVLPLNERLGIKNDVAASVFADTGEAYQQHGWPQIAPYTDMDGPGLVLSGRRSIQFSGSNYFYVASTGETYDSISVSMWVQLGSVPTSFRNIVGKYTGGGATNEMLLGFINSSGVRWRIAGTNGGGSIQEALSTTLVTTSLTHLVWTLSINGSDLDVALYINGVAEALTTSTLVGCAFILSDSTPWLFGADADAGFARGDFIPAGSRLQGVYVYRNRVITPSEAAQLYALGLSGNIPPIDGTGLGTNLRMMFNGDILPFYPQDVSGNGNHGTEMTNFLGTSLTPPLSEIPAYETLYPVLRFRGNTRVILTDFGMNDDASMFIAFYPTVYALQGLFGKSSTSNASVTEGHNLAQLWLSATGALLFQLHGQPGEVTSAPGIVPLNEWSTVLVTLESVGGVDTLIKIWLNKVLVVNTTVFGRTVNNGPQSFTGVGRLPWALGVDFDLSTPTDFFIGDLGQFGVWNTVFDEQTASDLDDAFRGAAMPLEPPRVVPESASDTIRGGLEVSVYARDVAYFSNERDDALLSGGAWSGSNAIATLQGIVLSTTTQPGTVASWASSDTYEHFDAAVDVTFLRPKTSRDTRELLLVTLTFTRGSSTLSVEVWRGPQTQLRVCAQSSAYGRTIRGSCLALNSEQQTGTLRLVRHAEIVWAFFCQRANSTPGYSTVIPLLATTQFEPGTGFLSLTASNQDLPIDVQTRLSNFTVEPHVRIGTRLLNDKRILFKRLVGKVPAATLAEVGSIELAAFGLFGAATSSAGFTYTLPTPRTVSRDANRQLRLYADEQVRDGEE